MYNKVYKKQYKNLINLKENTEYTFKINKRFSDKYNYKLRVKGEVGIPFDTRTEYWYPRYFRKLDDSISYFDGKKVLEFADYNFCHERTAYYMINSVDGSFDFALDYISSKDKNNIIVSLEIYYGDDSTRYYYEEADKKFSFNLDEYEKLSCVSLNYTLEKHVAFIMLKISAIDFNGTAKIFKPKFISNGVDLIDDFKVNQRELIDFKWIGEGFSLTERPSFNLKLNGSCIFDGLKRDSMNRFSGVEFTIPNAVLKNKNTFTLKLKDRNYYGYNIKEIDVIATPKLNEILAVSPYVVVGKKFGVLCYFSTKTKISFNDAKFEYLGKSEYEQGYYSLPFIAKKDGKAVVNILFNGKKYKFKTNAFSEKKDDVITSTSDFIYIVQETESFIEYLTWYIKNGLGSSMTFRCCYRWGKNAECNCEFWKKAVELLVDCGIYYNLMLDGRELNGANANPTFDMLNSKYFLGEQTHEKDGSYLYWDQELFYSDIVFCHAMSKKMERNGITAKIMPIYNKQGKAYLYTHGEEYVNMKDAYEGFIKNFKITTFEGATRHTGVTPMYDYIAKGGYSWLGIEAMYGTHELLFGALRGASKSYGFKSFGSHLALQWSTVPSDDYSHVLRYRTSLYLSYIHGISQINTEEGLWNIENPFEGFDRFSKTCKIHLKEQNSFFKFIQSHNRSGVFTTRIAMIKGQYDGMDCFSTGSVYAQKGEEWKYNTPEKSWDLLKIFYPQADLNAIYYFIIKGGEKNLRPKDKRFFDVSKEPYRGIMDYQSLGFYSSTPYGPIDIIPHDAKNFSDYKMLFFTGWNTCYDDQMLRLIDFVKNGGYLVLSKPHLFDSIDRKEVFSNKAKIIDSKLVEELLSYKNNVFFFDEYKYPCDIEKYSEKVIELANKFKCSYVSKVHNVSYTVYDNGNGYMTLYLLDINWWSKEKSWCLINCNGKERKIVLPKNKMIMLKINDKGYEIVQ